MRLLALRAETMQAMRRLKLPCDDITPIGLWGSDMFLIGVNNDQFEVLRLWNVQTEDVTPSTLRDLHTESTAIPTFPSAGNTASGARSSATAAPSAAPATSTATSSGSPGAGSPATAAFTPPPSAASVQRDTGPELVLAKAERAPAAVDIKPATVASAARAANGSAGLAAPTPSPAAGERRDGPDLKLEPSSQSSTSRSSRTEDGRATKSVRGDTPTRSTSKDGGQDNGASGGKLRMTVEGEHLYAEIKGGKIILDDRTYDSLAHARDSIRRERNKVAVWEYFDEGVKAWRVLNRD